MLRRSSLTPTSRIDGTALDLHAPRRPLAEAWFHDRLALDRPVAVTVGLLTSEASVSSLPQVARNAAAAARVGWVDAERLLDRTGAVVVRPPLDHDDRARSVRLERGDPDVDWWLDRPGGAALRALTERLVPDGRWSLTATLGRGGDRRGFAVVDRFGVAVAARYGVHGLVAVHVVVEGPHVRCGVVAVDPEPVDPEPRRAALIVWARTRGPAWVFGARRIPPDGARRVVDSGPGSGEGAAWPAGVRASALDASG